MLKYLFGPDDFDDDIEKDLTVTRNEGEEGPMNNPNLQILLENLKDEN